MRHSTDHKVLERKAALRNRHDISNLLHREVQNQLAIMHIQTKHPRTRRQDQLPLTSPELHHHVLIHGEALPP